MQIMNPPGQCRQSGTGGLGEQQPFGFGLQPAFPQIGRGDFRQLVDAGRQPFLDQGGRQPGGGFPVRAADHDDQNLIFLHRDAPDSCVGPGDPRGNPIGSGSRNWRRSLAGPPRPGAIMSPKW